MNVNNLILLTDSYKTTHWEMYPPKTEYVYSYFESRDGAKFNKTVFFGLQYLLQQLFTTPITQEDIEEGAKVVDTHIGPNRFNRRMWQYILRQHKGYMPLEIKAVPEGAPVDVSNVLMTVENTDPTCAALTNHFETILSHVWAPSTVATLSREVKMLCKHYLEQTADDIMIEQHLPFMLHDFGYRGVNQVEAAGICGLAHLINFLGTDTLAAMQYGRQYYGAGLDGFAYSVPASEHSVMTSRGEAGEKEVFEHLLRTYPEGILSVVIDSYNYRRFILEYAKEFKELIEKRPGRVVFRPDSGDPVAVSREVVEMLAGVFGSNINSKGYGVLPPYVGVIWGDGIDYDGIRNILFGLKAHSWSASNIVFGMGGGLLQKINRDVQRFAFKSSAQCRDGVWYDIFKNPLDSSKASKRGRLALVKMETTGYQTISLPNDVAALNNDVVALNIDCLKTVYKNGEVMNTITFDQVRKNAAL